MSEERSDAISEPMLERSADAAVVLGSDAVVTYASPSAGRIFGWEDRLVGSSMLPLLHPEDRPMLTRSLREVVADPGAVRPVVEIRVLAAGDWVWAEAALTDMLDDAEVRGVVFSVRPSLRRAAYDAAERQVAQLTEALESRVVIEQAKGFLAGRDGCTAAEGFERLRAHSRSHRVKIREVARRVLAGSLDVA